MQFSAAKMFIMRSKIESLPIGSFSALNIQAVGKGQIFTIGLGLLKKV